jgi:hypothetical protein
MDARNYQHLLGYQTVQGLSTIEPKVHAGLFTRTKGPRLVTSGLALDRTMQLVFTSWAKLSCSLVCVQPTTTCRTTATPASAFAAALIFR